MHRIATTLITSLALWAAACNCGENGEPEDGTETEEGSEAGTFEPSTTTMPPQESSGSDPTGEESETTAAPPAPNGATCEEGIDCESGICIAPFDVRRGDFVCAADCIGIMDEDNWCSDASACCDADAACTMRGYCLLE